MKVSRRQAQQFAILATTILVFSSCNRGYGCPMSDFSLTETLLDAAVSALSYIF